MHAAGKQHLDESTNPCEPEQRDKPGQPVDRATFGPHSCSYAGMPWQSQRHDGGTSDHRGGAPPGKESAVPCRRHLLRAKFEQHRPLAQRLGCTLQEGVDFWRVHVPQIPALSLNPPAQPCIARHGVVQVAYGMPRLVRGFEEQTWCAALLTGQLWQKLGMAYALPASAQVSCWPLAIRGMSRIAHATHTLHTWQHVVLCKLAQPIC